MKNVVYKQEDLEWSAIKNFDELQNYTIYFP